MKSPWISHFCWLRLFRFALKFISETFTPYSFFLPWNGFTEFVTSSQQSCCTICNWEYTFVSLCHQYFFCVDSSRTNVWCIQFFNSSKSAKSEYLLSIIPPRSMHIQKKILAICSFQIDEVLPDRVLDWEMFNKCSKWNYGTFKMVLRIVFQKEISLSA